MKTYVDVKIKSGYEHDEEFIEAIHQFAEDTDGWKFLVEQSAEYSSFSGEASCAVLREGNKYHPAIAITKMKDRTFYVANIVPKNSGRIVMSDYNHISRDFAIELRKHAKLHKAKLNVTATSDKVSLKSIIPGKAIRGLFERYLNLFPTSYHPSDISRLDAFICGVYRYSRKRIDLYLLKGWLMEEEKWSEKDAKWCVERIDIGLSILEANRKF